jgi:hypothetical protein
MAFLRFAGSGLDQAYVQVNLAAGLTDVYLEYDVYIPQATLDAEEADDGFLSDSFQLRRSDDTVRQGLNGIFGADWEWGIEIGSPPLGVSFGTITGDTWYTVGHRYNLAAQWQSTLQIDGADSGNGTFSLGFAGATNEPRKLRLGLVLFDGGGASPLPNDEVVVFIRNIKLGTSGFGGTELFDGGGDLGEFDSTDGDVSVVSSTGDPNPAAGVGRRFGRSPSWKYWVTDRNGAGVTFLDRLATNRTVTRILDEPAIATGNVPSDEPEVNIPYQLLTAPPFVHHNSRLLYCFRREGGTPPWVCRFGGIFMQLEDEGTDAPVSHFTAYDPWQYLYSRPVVTTGGVLPGQDGIEYTAPGNEIALELIENTIVAHGTVHLDIGQVTSDFEGTIETTPTINVVVEQGMSVGEALKMLCDTGTMDIVIDPVYDPEDRPGIVGVLSIYEQAGATRHNAVFAWDKPGRSLVNLSRLIDGTQLANKVQFFAGQGGPAVPVQTSSDSISRYGQYWAQQFFPGKNIPALVELLALAQLRQRQAGNRTVSFAAAPERSPIPFQEFDIGDYVPVWASRRFRDPMAPNLDDPPEGYQRVTTMPLEITDDGVEELRGVLVQTDSTEGAPGGTVVTPPGSGGSTTGDSLPGEITGDNLNPSIPGWDGVGTTYYVDAAAGSDANTETQAQTEGTAWATMQHAAENFEFPLVGDVRILVKNGDYEEPASSAGSAATVKLTAMGARSPSSDHVLHILNYPGHTPRVLKPGITGGTPGSSERHGFWFDDSSVKYVRVSGFDVDGEGSGTCNQHQGFRIDAGVHHVDVSRNEIHGWESAAVGTNPRSQGIYEQATDSFFYDNNIHDNGNPATEAPGASHGIYTASGAARNTYGNNETYDHPNGFGHQFYSGGTGGSGHVVTHLLSAGNSMSGMVVDGPFSVKVFNSEFYDNAAYAITGRNGATIEARYNLTHLNGDAGNLGGGYNNHSAATFVVSDNLTGDPLFDNYAGRDFHLDSASPCYDAGLIDYATVTDIEGTVRLVATLGPYASPLE